MTLVVFISGSFVGDPNISVKKNFMLVITFDLLLGNGDEVVCIQWADTSALPLQGHC
jgi:hypothetical protein